MQRLQLDDMLPGTPFPVVLGPALQQQQQAAGAGGIGAQPILALTWTSVAGGARGRSYLPLILVRWVVVSLLPLLGRIAVSCDVGWKGSVKAAARGALLPPSVVR